MDVVVPFRGAAAELAKLRGSLERLRLAPGDSVVVVDNTPRPQPAGSRDGPVTVLHDPGVQAPAFARNRGAACGVADWLVFFDADTIPSPDLLDRYFDPPPAERTALLAGGVLDEAVPADAAAVPRYAYIRGLMGQENTFRLGRWSFPQMANAACRRVAFESVGGFREDIRAAEDADLAHRLRTAGWQVERREGASVVHRNRQTVRGLVAQKLCHGAGGAWLNHVHPGSLPPRRRPGLVWWGVRTAVRGLATAARTRDRDRALWAIFDPLEQLTYEFGRSRSNDIPARNRSLASPRPPATHRDPSEAPVSVCAVLVIQQGECLPAVLEAIEAQTRKPDELIIALPASDATPQSRDPAVLPDGARPATGAAEALHMALDGEASWLWLLDGSALPAPAALACLLGYVDLPGMPPPVLLASKVMRQDGSLDPTALPVAQARDPDFAVAAFERRVLSLRMARRGSLLVARSAFEAVASRWPHLTPFAEDLEWTARALKHRPGLLVPASIVVRRPPVNRNGLLPDRAEIASRLRLLLGGAIELGDKPWFAFRFLEEALAGLRRRRHG